MVNIQKCNRGRQALGDECHENGHCEGECLGGLAFVDGGDPNDEEHNCEDNRDAGDHDHKAGTWIVFFGLVPKFVRGTRKDHTFLRPTETCCQFHRQ